MAARVPILRTEKGQPMDNKMNILLVDDDPGKLLTYEVILEELGENLIKACSGMEALERMLKNDIGVVLMDASMPGIDGFETARMIHDHPRFQNVPIIFVSGILVTDIDCLKGYENGAVDYVPVPIVPQLLRAKVRVFADLHRKTRELESMNSRITALQEEERRRIARELHDSVGQLLVAIGMNNTELQAQCATWGLEARKRLVENATMISEVSKQIRTISYLLHPPLLEEAGLSAAVRIYVEGFSQRSKIETAVEIPPDLGRLGYPIELGLFRLVQECLTNVHRHSHSPTAVIRVVPNETFIRVEIQDNGTGFSRDRQSALDNGVGLRGAQERLRELGGTLQIETGGEGTRIIAIVPIRSVDLNPHLTGLQDPASSVISGINN
jgi:signal transduction histidine kinase